MQDVSSLLLMRPTSVVSPANLMMRLKLDDALQSYVSVKTPHFSFTLICRIDVQPDLSRWSKKQAFISSNCFPLDACIRFHIQTKPKPFYGRGMSFLLIQAPFRRGHRTLCVPYLHHHSWTHSSVRLLVDGGFVCRGNPNQATLFFANLSFYKIKFLTQNIYA